MRIIPRVRSTAFRGRLPFSWWIKKGFASFLLITLFLANTVKADPGDLDTSFGTGGKVTTNFGASSEEDAEAVVIQSDGKIVVAGVSDASGSNDFALARYNKDGSLDTSFGDQGVVLDDFGGFGKMQSAEAIALQPNGSIVVAGTGTLTLLDFEFPAAAVARYNTDGSADSSFGVDGLAFPSPFFESDARALAIQDDGKIVVAGEINANSSPDFFVTRLNADGSLDSSFGDAGAVLTDFSGNGSLDRAYALAIQSDGKIVVAGFSLAGGSNDFALARYNTDGSLDNGFGSGGVVTTDFSDGSFDQAFSLTIQSDGKIIVAGTSNASGISDDFALARYNTDGMLDTSFGGDGLVFTELREGSRDVATGLAIQSNGKIVVAGHSLLNDITDFALARYNTDGGLDNSFGSSGLVITDFSGSGSEDLANGLAVQPDGKIVVARSSNASGNDDFALARYLDSITPPVPTPTPSPTPAPGAPQPGDANADGQINILDVTVILNDILEISSASGNGDCNEDGEVNILDVTCVLNKILEF